MQYKNEIVDPDGYTHSIDMVIIDYFIHCNYCKFAEKVLDAFGHIPGFSAEKHSSLGNQPSHKYMYYVDMIWFDGLVIYLGKYTNYDKLSKSWDKLDSLRIKVNPNKHLDSEAMRALLPLLRQDCSDGCLVRYDYAVDIPCSIQDVLVIGTRKEHGLYKGTRYYGQRHKHGYCKIYDKAKESGLDYALTRLEYTFQSGLPPSWDNIIVRASVKASDGPLKLSKTLKLYLDMLDEIRALGGQIEPYIERMDFKSYKKIEPFLYTGKQLQVNQDIVDRLLSGISDTFIIAYIEQSVKSDDENIDEFVKCETDLPFD